MCIVIRMGRDFVVLWGQITGAMGGGAGKMVVRQQVKQGRGLGRTALCGTDKDRESLAGPFESIAGVGRRLTVCNQI